jgi:hypothetical protein
MEKIDKIVKIAAYIILVVFIFILIDIFVFNRMLGFGNSRYKLNLNADYKIPYPYVGFVDKKIAEAEPYSMYYTGRKLYDNNEGKIKIAFFGGSAAAYRDWETPNSYSIPEYLEQRLKEKLNKDVVVINYASGGAIHRQHLHMLLEFMPKFKPDIIIYYGGHNETIQYYGDDPRPGYPFNYFYRQDFQTWKRFLLEYSAIIGVLDEKFNIWNKNKLYKRIGFGTNKWEKEIIDNYFETIDMSKKVANTFDSELFGKPIFITIFQPLNYPEGDQILLDSVREKFGTITDSYDYYHKFDDLPKDIWYGYCHVKDPANRYMAEEIANMLTDKYLKKYKK